MVDFFLHIPKCGGSSLRTLFARNYPAGEILSFAGYRPEVDWFLAASGEFKARHKLVQGHFPYGLHAGLALRDVRYVTLLRDPVERHFSEIKYGLRSTYHPLNQAFVRNEISLSDWAKWPATDPYFADTITRYLTGTPAILDLESRTRELLPVGPAETRTARERLLGFAAFGLAEDFTRSVLLIGRALGWETVAYAVRNVSPPMEIPETALAAARPFFAADEELLRFARAVFAERVHAAGALLEDAAAELDDALACEPGNVPEDRHREYILGVDPAPAAPEPPAGGAVGRFLASRS